MSFCPRWTPGAVSLTDCYQKQGQTNVAFCDKLKAWADTIEFYGGSFAECYTLVPEEGPGGVILSVAARKKLAYDRTMGVAYMRKANTDRYGVLIAELANNYAEGKDQYPQSLQEAFKLPKSYTLPTLMRRRSTSSSTNQPAPRTTTTSPEASAMTFAQATEFVAGNNGATHETVECFQCHVYGHYAHECPQRAEPSTGTTLVQYAYMLLAPTDAAGIDPNWILLDSQSTISVFKQKRQYVN